MAPQVPEQRRRHSRFTGCLSSAFASVFAATLSIVPLRADLAGPLLSSVSFTPTEAACLQLCAATASCVAYSFDALGVNAPFLFTIAGQTTTGSYSKATGQNDRYIIVQNLPINSITLSGTLGATSCALLSGVTGVTWSLERFASTLSPSTPLPYALSMCRPSALAAGGPTMGSFSVMQSVAVNGSLLSSSFVSSLAQCQTGCSSVGAIAFQFSRPLLGASATATISGQQLTGGYYRSTNGAGDLVCCGIDTTGIPVSSVSVTATVTMGTCQCLSSISALTASSSSVSGVNNQQLAALFPATLPPCAASTTIPGPSSISLSGQFTLVSGFDVTGPAPLLSFVPTSAACLQLCQANSSCVGFSFYSAGLATPVTLTVAGQTSGYVRFQAQNSAGDRDGDRWVPVNGAGVSSTSVSTTLGTAFCAQFPSVSSLVPSSAFVGGILTSLFAALTTCPPGSYYASGSCTSCPIGVYTTGSQAGSTSVSSCTICAPGYYGAVVLSGTVSASGCAACPAGFYAAAGAQACTACPTGVTTLLSRSTSVAACTLCAIGFYGSVTSSGTLNAAGCAACPAGYSTGTQVGSTDIAACTSCAAGYLGSAAGGCTPCPAGTWGYSGMPACVPCSPGTYSLIGAAVCSLCPAGTFGDHAGLSTAACSGACATCSAGSTVPSSSPFSCNANDARAVPSNLGLQIWPAANPSNPQATDLLVAPIAVCQRMASSSACAAAASILGADGVVRYVVGTAASFNVEPAESLTCTTS